MTERLDTRRHTQPPPTQKNPKNQNKQKKPHQPKIAQQHKTKNPTSLPPLKKTPRNKKDLYDSPNKQKGSTTQNFNCNLLIEFHPRSLGSTKKEKLNTFFCLFSDSYSDIKEIFHQDTRVCVCVCLHTNIITDTKFLPKKIKTPLKQLSFLQLLAQKTWKSSEDFPPWRKTHCDSLGQNSPSSCLLHHDFVCSQLGKASQVRWHIMR